MDLAVTYRRGSINSPAARVPCFGANRHRWLLMVQMGFRNCLRGPRWGPCGLTAVCCALSQLSQVFPHSWSEELVNVQMLQRPRGSSRPDGSLRCRRARCGVGARRAGRPGGGASPEAQVSQSDISLQNPDPPRSEGTLKTAVFPGRRSVSEAAGPEGDTFAPGAGGAALLQRRARGRCP